MGGYKRILLLICIMTLTVVIVGGVAVNILLNMTMKQQRQRLIETAQSQARLIEAVARFDEKYSSDYLEGSHAATLSQISNAHENYHGFGKTGEFTLAKKENNQIVFLLRHRRSNTDKLEPVPFQGKLAEPMRRALSGQSGTVIGLDYSGVIVLAAYEPVSVLNLGIVAKIDMEEVNAPFVKAGWAILIIGVLVVSVGTFLFFLIGNPMVRRLRKSQERTRMLLETMNDGFGIIDENGVFTYANDRLVNMLGQPLSTEGCRACEVFLGKGGRLIEDWASGDAAPPIGSHELTWAREDGEQITALISPKPLIEDGKVGRGIFTVFTDISRQKKAEEALQLAHDDLEQRVLTRTLELTQEVAERRRAESAAVEKSLELARSNADLEQFAYVASHDLQEPLRIVSSYVQLLERRNKGKLSAESDEFMAYVVEGAQRMHHLIHDLLAFSRVHSEGGGFTPTDTARALDQALENLTSAMEESGAEVVVGDLPSLKADSSQLISLFQNLVGNAIKYRHPDRPPNVRIHAEQNGEGWIFSVTDNGIGIAPEFRDKIFKVFQRLHPREAYEGTGIGLAVCKRIVERHGGRIWTEANPDGGSVFAFTLDGEGGEGMISP